MKEYEIFKRESIGIYGPTGLVINAKNKTQAIKLAREKLGSGTYSAKESSIELRAKQAQIVAEVKDKLENLVYIPGKGFRDKRRWALKTSPN